MDGVFYDLFSTARDLSTYYEDHVAAYGATAATSCATGTHDVPYTLTFPDKAKLQGPGYRLLCFKDTNGAWLEQEDPADTMLITYLLKSGDQSKLYDWWTNTQTSVNPHPKE